MASQVVGVKPENAREILFLRLPTLFSIQGLGGQPSGGICGAVKMQQHLGADGVAGPAGCSRRWDVVCLEELTGVRSNRSAVVVV